MKDLEGKRIVLGSPGSGSSDNSRFTLRTLGIKAIESELAFGEAAQALAEGKVDAMGMSGSPAAGIVELAATRDIYIIPFTDEELDKLVAAGPFFSKGVMPANTYDGQTKDVPVFMFTVYQVASKNVPADDVYEMMKVCFSPEGQEYLGAVHPNWKSMGNDPELVEALGIPYHPVPSVLAGATTMRNRGIPPVPPKKKERCSSDQTRIFSWRQSLFVKVKVLRGDRLGQTGESE